MCDRTTSPQWNEAFCFPVQDPREDILVVKVRWLQFIRMYNEVKQMLVMQVQTVWSLIYKYSYDCLSPALPHLDPAHWLTGCSYQRATVWTGAGPGPVVPSGWSLTWESGSSASSTQGGRILCQFFYLSHSKCFTYGLQVSFYLSLYLFYYLDVFLFPLIVFNCNITCSIWYGYQQSAKLQSWLTKWNNGNFDLTADADFK